MADERGLERYRQKRSADRTPEPFGSEPRPGDPAGERRLFVVQKHAATRLHYDFRLELDGVLVSWAVPKGPCFDPAEKRMAVHVEDHPVEYANFEGVIPEGNYGAGPSICWDRGVWIAREDPRAGLANGKLSFELHGYKLRGEWHLVRTKRHAGSDPKEWLLIKAPDAWAGQRTVPEESVLSGLTVEELGAGSQRRDELARELERLDPPRATLAEAELRPMLAQTAEAPFSRDGWLFELKHDGYRLLAVRQAAGARLLYRSGLDATAVFPELQRAIAALPGAELVLDGEAVVLLGDGRPSFEALQKRGRLQNRFEIERASLESPATLYAFDLLAAEGRDLRGLPLVERKRLLRLLLPPSGPLRYSDHVEREGEALYAEVSRMGLEGLVAKRAGSRYQPGRSADWLKVKADRTAEFAVVGFTAPKGSREGLGALHVARHDGQGFVYAGKVGSGLVDAQLGALRTELEAARVEGFPCHGEPPDGRDHVWCEPRQVVEVRYREVTSEGLLRHPVFVRFRDDRRPEECRSEREAEPVEPAPPAAAPPEPAGKVVRLTNLDKVFWPAEGLTKGDLVAFYREVAPFLLPYLADRPLVLTRFPDGIEGKSFYQKDAPGFAPAWLRTVRVWSEHSQRDIDYFVCEDVESLLWVANSAAIPLHVWSSRVATIQSPDWCILDLDPKGAPFAHVVELALEIRRLLDEIGLPGFVKTSGSTGLHVLLPLGRLCTYEQSRSLGELIAWVVVRRRPEIATIARSLRDRGGKVYIDFLQNVHGQLLVSPFSVRPLPGAPVSTPLEWSEVGSTLRMADFDIRSVPARLARLGDPLRGVLDTVPDLLGALSRLQALLPAAE